VKSIEGSFLFIVGTLAGKNLHEVFHESKDATD